MDLLLPIRRKAGKGRAIDILPKRALGDDSINAVVMMWQAIGHNPSLRAVVLDLHDSTISSPSEISPSTCESFKGRMETNAHEIRATGGLQYYYY